jgi:DNA invertase Pin-like site-specific DNA recombinase
MGERARIWQRVSTSGQDEASQLPDCVRWCDSHGYEYDAAESYVVHGKSAWKGKHAAELDRAFADMAAGEYAVLVVWKQDRIERRGMEAALNLVSRAKAAGGRIEFVTQPHLNKLNDMAGRISYVIMAEVAQAESETKSDRIIAKHNALRAAGSVVGRAPWGYAIEERDGRKVLVPTDEGRIYIPQIYQRIIDGQSLRQVAAWLDSQGVKPMQGQRWNEGYLAYRLIRNATYKGRRVNSGNLETEALVSPSTFDHALAALASRAYRGRGTVVHEKPLVMPVCGACYLAPHVEGPRRKGCPSGISPMYRVFAGKSRTPYMRCTGHGPGRQGCGAPMVPLADLEAEVIGSMADNHLPHLERVFVPGDDRSDEISRHRADATEAISRGDYEAATAAMQSAAKLESAPRVAPHWELRVSDQSEADWFEGLDPDGRRAALADYEITAQRVDGEVSVTIVPRALVA